MSTHDLPTRHTVINSENWQQELNTMACNSACDVLKQLKPSQTVEIAFATLQAYFLLTYANSCPLLECTEPQKRAARLSAIQDILDSCGLSLESSIITQALN